MSDRLREDREEELANDLRELVSRIFHHIAGLCYRDFSYSGELEPEILKLAKRLSEREIKREGAA